MKSLDLFQSDDGRFTSTEKEVGLYEQRDIELNIKFVKYLPNELIGTGTYLLVLNSGEIVVDCLTECVWRTSFDSNIIMRSADCLPTRLAYIK